MCQQRVAELEEEVDIMAAENRALELQGKELKQYLAALPEAMSFNHKVGTVVAHADHVTLQYRAS